MKLITNTFVILNQKILTIFDTGNIKITVDNFVRETVWNSLQAFNRYPKEELSNLSCIVDNVEFFDSYKDLKFLEVKDNCLGMSSKVLKKRMELIASDDKKSNNNFGYGLKYTLYKLGGGLIRTWYEGDLTMIWIGPDENRNIQCIQINNNSLELSSTDFIHELKDIYFRSREEEDTLNLLNSINTVAGTSIVLTGKFLRFNTEEGFSVSLKDYNYNSLESIGSNLSTKIYDIKDIVKDREFNDSKDIIKVKGDILSSGTVKSPRNINGFIVDYNAQKVFDRQTKNKASIYASFESDVLDCPVIIQNSKDSDNEDNIIPEYVPIKLAANFLDIGYVRGGRGFNSTYLVLNGDIYNYCSRNISREKGHANFVNRALTKELLKQIGLNVSVVLIEPSVQSKIDIKPAISRTYITYSSPGINTPTKIEKVLDQDFLSEELLKLLFTNKKVQEYIQYKTEEILKEAQELSPAMEGSVRVFQNKYEKLINKIFKKTITKKSNGSAKSSSGLQNNKVNSNPTNNNNNSNTITKIEKIKQQITATFNKESTDLKADSIALDKIKTQTIKKNNSIVSLDRVLSGKKSGFPHLIIKFIDNIKKEDIFVEANSENETQNQSINCLIVDHDKKLDRFTIYINKYNPLTILAKESICVKNNISSMESSIEFRDYIAQCFYTTLFNIKIKNGMINNNNKIADYDQFTTDINLGVYNSHFDIMLALKL